MSTCFSSRSWVTTVGMALLLGTVGGWAPLAGATPITTFDTAIQFRTNTGPNSVGLPVGDYQQVGVMNVSPTAGTVVTATQGAVVRPLPFTPFTAFPTFFRSLDPFDPSLTGTWSITATNGPDSAGPILTNAILNAQLVPLAQNLALVGGGATPTLTWTLPDLRASTSNRLGSSSMTTRMTMSSSTPFWPALQRSTRFRAAFCCRGCPMCSRSS